jgi:hypothetical protein
MCKTCESLTWRCNSLAQRINRDPYPDRGSIRRQAYNLILWGIRDHMIKTGHEVDSLEVLIALGKRHQGA